MDPPGRPKRVSGFHYDQPGPVYHVRIGVFDRQPAFSEVHAGSRVVEALRFRHGRSARILTYCVMPDHVHLLLSLLHPGASLSSWVGDFKRWLSRETGVHWQPGFYEHIVRKRANIPVIAKYILANPVQAGLATSWQEYGNCGSLTWEL